MNDVLPTVRNFSYVGCVNHMLHVRATAKKYVFWKNYIYRILVQSYRYPSKAETVPVRRNQIFVIVAANAVKRCLRVTGAPVACATVLRWAPSRVTRRGALTATAAAAAAIFPSFFLSPSLLLAVHVLPFLLGPFCRCHSPLGPAGPVGTTASPPWCPWSRGSQPSPLQNTPSLFRLHPNAATDGPLFSSFFFLPLSFSFSLRSFFLQRFLSSDCEYHARASLAPSCQSYARFDSSRWYVPVTLACYSFYPKFLLLLLSSATESNGFKILAPIVCISLLWFGFHLIWLVYKG